MSGTEITLGSTTAGATIYYTMDGSIPTVNSAVYGEVQLTITGDFPLVTLKAIAVKPGMFNSEVMIASYTLTRTSRSS